LYSGHRGSVRYCYSTGNVSGGSYVGGLVGNNGGRVSRSFWDNYTSGKNSSSGGTGKNTTDMKIRKTFEDANWDFNNDWCMIENVTY